MNQQTATVLTIALVANGAGFLCTMAAIRILVDRIDVLQAWVKAVRDEQ